MQFANPFGPCTHSLSIDVVISRFNPKEPEQHNAADNHGKERQGPEVTAVNGTRVRLRAGSTRDSASHLVQVTRLTDWRDDPPCAEAGPLVTGRILCCASRGGVSHRACGRVRTDDRLKAGHHVDTGRRRTEFLPPPGQKDVSSTRRPHRSNMHRC